MKKLLYTLLFLCVTNISAPCAYSNDNPQTSKNEAIKEAKNQAKMLVKEGFIVAEGMPSIRKQLVAICELKYESEGNRYLVAIGEAQAPNISMAKAQAEAQAKINLASQIAVEITVIAQNYEDETSSTSGISNSVQQFLIANMQIVQQRLKNLVEVVNMYKIESNVIRYNIGFAYDTKEAVRITRDVLKQKDSNLIKEFDEIFSDGDF